MHLRRYILPFVAALGSSVVSPALGQDSASARPGLAAIDAPHLKKKSVAVALGLLPGGGHLYAGEPRRAALTMGTFTLGAFMLGRTSEREEATCDPEGSECEWGHSESRFHTSLLGLVLVTGSWVYSVLDAPSAVDRSRQRTSATTRSAALLVMQRNGLAIAGVTLRGL